MNKFAAFFDLFRRGSAVADPALWKNRSALALAIAGLLAALVQLAKVYGYELPVPLTHDEIAALAGGIATVIGIVCTFVTSDKVGLPAKPEPNPFPPLDSPKLPGDSEAP